jgi:hypothetical protein
VIILSSSDGRTVRTSRARKRASYRACEGLRDGRGCDVLAAAACAIIEGRPRVWREDERRAHRVERPDRKQSSDLSATPSTPRCSRSSAPKDRARTSVDLRSGGLRCASPFHGLRAKRGVRGFAMTFRAIYLAPCAECDRLFLESLTSVVSLPRRRGRTPSARYHDGAETKYRPAGGLRPARSIDRRDAYTSTTISGAARSDEVAR